MNLEDIVRENEELTAALAAALGAGDEAACAPLLDRRTLALSRLGQAVGDATPAQRSAVQARLEALVDADRDLRTAAATALAEAGEAFRAHCGTASRGASNPDPAARPACLDQRA